ncbi:helix-turn-helix domain-containing protein [Maricaulis parjimensis]|uniref:helix-turn-helix domain-containing protein n=1 Tax=Maricaulis parjimensis TaxID=144023 RepID=UPI0019395B7A|nr:helix-turn-helix domain-containing protein [Maricaulis parjimensis]
MSGQASGIEFVPVDAVYADDGVGYVSMTAGERLQEARARMNLSLKQAADATRIRADYLEALEAMDSRGLPARAYAIGYLRTYANFLSLEPHGLVEQFKREVDTETGRAQPTAAAKSRDPIQLPRGVFGVAFILIIVAAAAWWYAEQGGSSGLLSNPPSPPDAAPDWARADFDVAAQAPSVEDIWNNLPLSQATTLSSAVVMRAIVPTFLEVRDASGRILFARELGAGETFQALEPGLTVSAANAGAIRLERDGETLGLLGTAGTPVENLPILASAEIPVDDAASQPQ